MLIQNQLSIDKASQVKLQAQRKKSRWLMEPYTNSMSSTRIRLRLEEQIPVYSYLSYI